MRYQSTRNTDANNSVSFEQAILTGLAPDGGLYLPQNWPQFSQDEWQDMAGLSYSELATRLLYPFYEGFIDKAGFHDLAKQSYQSFRHEAVAPLRDMEDGILLLELFHGPTFAFKDFALQLLARLMAHALDRNQQKMTIIGATSGDTGSAAIEAFAGIDQIEIFILHPNNRVSDVQRRQMTTQSAKNVHNIAIEGSFDDCQDLVKALFADKNFRQEQSLGAVNSINWGRIMIQTVYYAHAMLSLPKPHQHPVTIHVPTGNFGNIFAAWIARKMGLEIDKLSITSNANDILTRFFENNDMSMQGVIETLAPSMDIQISSNFERYLYELMGRDGNKCAKLIQDFRQSGHLPLDEALWLKAKSEFSGYRLDDKGILATIKATYDKTGIILDPHTATAYECAKSCEGINIVAATAHPAKFPDAINQAIGRAPAPPPVIAALFDKQENYQILANDEDALKALIKERN